VNARSRWSVGETRSSANGAKKEMSRASTSLWGGMTPPRPARGSWRTTEHREPLSRAGIENDFAEFITAASKIELLVKILCVFLVYCFFLYYVCFYLRVNKDEYYSILEVHSF